MNEFTQSNLFHVHTQKLSKEKSVTMFSSDNPHIKNYK